MLDPHLGTIIWTLVTFLFVLVVLKATVWKPLLSALDEREKRISDALESADKAREEAQSALSENQEKLAEAEEEAREIVRKSREEAEKVGQEIVEKARAEAQLTVDQARTSIETEKLAALTELRREVADLSVQAASTLIDANLDDEKNRKLVDDLIAGIPQAPAENN